MAFTWNSVSAGTVIKAADINQVKTNVDTLTTNLGIAAYSWSELAVSQGDEDTAAQISELQDALDYVDTNNVCNSDNSTQYGTNNADKDGTIDGTFNGAVDGTEHNTDNAVKDLTAQVTYYTAVDSDQHYSYCGGWNQSYNSTQYLTVYNPRNAAVK
jgi:hypothetical protein